MDKNIFVTDVDRFTIYFISLLTQIVRYQLLAEAFKHSYYFRLSRVQ